MSDHGPLIARMEEIGDRLVADNDERQHFHGAYVRSTKAVMKDAEAGNFIDPAWAERWAIAFAQLYMDAFDAWERGDDLSGPWRVAFEASRDPGIPPVRHALLGINAHINYDLPQDSEQVILQFSLLNQLFPTTHQHQHSIIHSYRHNVMLSH